MFMGLNAMRDYLYARSVTEEETHRYALEFIMKKTGCTSEQAEMALSKFRSESYPGFISTLVAQLGLNAGEFQTFLKGKLSASISPNPIMQKFLGSMNANIPTLGMLLTQWESVIGSTESFTLIPWHLSQEDQVSTLMLCVG